MYYTLGMFTWKIITTENHDTFRHISMAQRTYGGIIAEYEILS